jgi:arabinogalactan endo-1,4-beta-galactosidase
MIDFHYSDSWADPGQQTKPAAWASHTFTQLLSDLYNHTYDVIDTLKSIGATPDWVQIGNEIAGGMLWPDGSTSNWTQLAQLLNKGYDAVKAVDSNIKVIIHLEGGNDNYKCRTFFDNATIRNVRYDIIGLSYYPYWIGSDYTETIDDLGYNMNDLVARYGKKIMVVEVGGLYNQVQNTYDMLVAVIQKTMAVPGNKGLGVIYWEPEGEKTWSGYGLSCWNAGGKPTRALNAFLYGLYTGIDEEVPRAALRIYPNPNFTGILNIESSDLKGPAEIDISDISGKPVKTIPINDMSRASIDLNLPSGAYILRISRPNGTICRKLIVQ